MEIKTQDKIEQADNDEQRTSSREQKSDHFFYLLSLQPRRFLRSWP
jgi:hypothetical protein